MAESANIPPETKPSYEQLVDESIANDAVKEAGGPAEINGCKL